MLQIGTGKLFTRDIGHRNNLKGIIYTNLRLMNNDQVDTVAGSISATSIYRDSNVLIFELEELIESTGNGPGIIASHGISSFIVDFCSILSFALNCSASTSYKLYERLLGDEIGVTTHIVPSKLVKKTFDKTIFCQNEQKQFLKHFTYKLIGLNRKTFIGVMNSIRTYVTGMQSIADDLELAYTLLVASIESLAQDFDGHEATWMDYDQRKRARIDAVLTGVDDNLAQGIKNAILQNEHTSLGKRFKEFAIEHINPSFYREEAANSINPLTSFDLPVVLTNAYIARSKYIHNLKKLPKQLTIESGFTETFRVDNKTWLTLEGLSRLARHVITEFIMRQPTVEREQYDYSLELPNLIQMNLAPQHWVWQLDFRRGVGVKKLEGFLSQLASNLENIPNQPLTDLTELLTKLEQEFDSLGLEDKKSFLSLYMIYNHMISIPNRLVNRLEFSRKHEHLLSSVCPCSLITSHLLYISPNWSLEEHHEGLLRYFRERDNRTKFRCPKLFEAGMLLQLAERYREIHNIEKSLELIAMAVENFPENVLLKQFEIDYIAETKPIDAYKIFFPEIEDAMSEK